MGWQYSVACPCGYKESELMDGYGAMDQRNVIIECQRCGRLSSEYLGTSLMSAQSLIEGRCCGHCQSEEISLYSAQGLEGNRCPKCGDHTLVFTLDMEWF